MKNFADYLTESKKTYKFIVRVAGNLPEQCGDTMSKLLEKFGKVSMTGPKRTPIQETPMDFPQLQNMEVHTWEVEVSYPTTRQVMQEYLGNGCGIQESHINVRAEGDPVEEDQTSKVQNEPYEAMLNTEDMGGESAQELVASNRVMDLLKELETARKERNHDPIDGTPKGESKDIDESENTKSVMGS